MPNDIIPEDPGLLASIGDFIGNTGYLPRNLMQGNWEGAGRNLVDFAGDIVDSALPGNWIPHISRPEDKPEFSDLIGGMEEGWGKTLTNLVGNTLTDPLTFVPGAAVLKGLGAAGKGVGAVVNLADKVIPGTAKNAQAALVNTKSAMGWLKSKDPVINDLLTRATNAKANVRTAGQTEVGNIFKDTTPEQRQDLFDVVNNIAYKNSKWEEMAPGTTPLGPAGTFSTKEDQLARYGDRIDQMDRTPEQKAALKGLAENYGKYTQGQFKEGVEDIGAFTKPEGRDLNVESPTDYASRRFQDLTTEGDASLVGSAHPQGRTIKSNEQLTDLLNEPGMSVERDLGLASNARAAQQGRFAERAAIGKGLLGDKFVSLADEGSRGGVSKAIAALAESDPEGHRLLQQAWDGQGQPGKFMQFLQGANKVFKPAAVYGLGFPRVGGIMKNILSFPAQLAMEGEAAQAGAQVLRTPQTVWNAMRTGVAKAFGWELPADFIGQSSDMIATAFKQSGGQAKNAEAFLVANGREDLALAMKHGVTDGFVGRESFEDTIANSTWGKRLMSQIGMGEKAQAKAFDLMDAPAAGFQGAETHARLGTFLDLYNKGLKAGEGAEQAAAKAAGTTREGLYDYDIKTGANRTLRTIIPFAAYQTNAIRQTAKFAVNNPWAAVAGSEALRRDKDKPIYPYMEGKTNIPLGRSDTGDNQYITGLGLPFEALNGLPNPSAGLMDFGSDVRNKLIGSSQPLIKTATAVVTGQDPYFDTPAGSYSKLPGNIEGGAFGRGFNMLAGTGLIQPLITPLQQIGTAIDDRTTLAQKALQFGTGTRVVNVNEDRALSQQLQQFIKNNPDIKAYSALYTQGNNPDTKAVLEELKALKKRIKEKRLSESAHIPETVPSLL